jgi:transposase
VARVLQDHVTRVVVSNPLVTKAIAQAKVKTDKVDAHVLAQLLRCDFLPEVWHPDTTTQQLRELTGRRVTLVQQRTALRNRIHSALAMRLIEAPESLFDSAGQDWLAKLLPTLDAQGQLLISSDLRLLQAVQQEIDTLGQQLAKQGWQDQRVRLLMTLPGVDVTVAESVLAALGDIERFPTPEQAAAYVGLVPSTRQSADKCYHGPITKRGNNQARGQKRHHHNQRRQTDPLGEGHACTWRTMLFKVAATIVVSTRRVRVLLSGSWPYANFCQAVSQAVLGFTPPALHTG